MGKDVNKLDILVIELDSGADAALLVNGELVTTIDTDFEGDGSIENLHLLAANLARVTGGELRTLDNHPRPSVDDWNWQEVIDSLPGATPSPT